MVWLSSGSIGLRNLGRVWCLTQMLGMSVGGCAGLQRVDEVEQGGFALAQTEVIDAVVAQHVLGREGGVQAADDDRNVADAPQFAEHVARA